MGNIQSLTRNGWQDSPTFTNMDVLGYDYDSGNKLLKVTDTGNKAHGFKDGTNTNNDFEYDSNGNLKIDRNKGITNIAYNHLNLPVQVTFASGNIQYFYSADGTKQKKVVSTGTETLYAGNYIYEGTTGNAQLQFFNHPEGYVMPKDVNNYSAGFDYVYNYKDHLGNIRISYTDANGDGSVGTSEIVKENNYYPFGLKIRGYNENISSLGNSVAKRYMFGGKEYQEEFNINWYDVTARNYDPALGRWFVIDPKADDILQVDITPYNYSWNNPTNINDPDGECPMCWGAAIGALVEAGSQIAVNMIVNDQSFFEAAGNIDLERVVVAAATGAATGGLSSIKVIGSTSKIFKAVAISSTAAGGNIVTQALEGNATVDPIPMMQDAIFEQIPSVKTPEIPNVPQQKIKTAENKVDRAQRVAGDNPRPTRADAVKESKNELNKLEQKNEVINNTNQAIKQTSDETLEEAGKVSLENALQKYRDEQENSIKQ